MRPSLRSQGGLEFSKLLDFCRIAGLQECNTGGFPCGRTGEVVCMSLPKSAHEDPLLRLPRYEPAMNPSELGVKVLFPVVKLYCAVSSISCVLSCTSRILCCNPEASCGAMCNYVCQNNELVRECERERSLLFSAPTGRSEVKCPRATKWDLDWEWEEEGIGKADSIHGSMG